MNRVDELVWQAQRDADRVKAALIFLLAFAAAVAGVILAVLT